MVFISISIGVFISISIGVFLTEVTLWRLVKERNEA